METFSSEIYPLGEIKGFKILTWIVLCHNELLIVAQKLFCKKNRYGG